MARFVTLVPADELPPGAREVFEVEGLYIAVFNVDGTVYAVEDVCTHDDGPLADGELHGFEIECPRHGARFDIRSGKVTRMPAVLPVRWFPARIEDGQVQVDLGD